MNYKPKETKYNFKKYLGRIKGTNENVYLMGFSWDCGWYWSGGHITTHLMHTHFDGCFLNIVDVRGHCLGNFVSPWYKGDYPDEAKEISNGCAVWEGLGFFLDFPQFTNEQWWRVKDLYKQFYTLRKCAETFRCGGNCTSEGRNPKEINIRMENNINRHIEDVIIPEIYKIMESK